MNLFVNRIRREFLIDVEKIRRRENDCYLYCEKTNHFVRNCFHKFLNIRAISINFISIAQFVAINFSKFAFVRKMQKKK